jgi:hypothetical protein
MIKRPSGTALGSVIDIEAACSDKMVSSVSQLPENIEKTRLVVKSLFFDLLNKDFLESLEPNYED